MNGFLGADKFAVDLKVQIIGSSTAPLLLEVSEHDDATSIVKGVARWLQQLYSVPVQPDAVELLKRREGDGSYVTVSAHTVLGKVQELGTTVLFDADDLKGWEVAEVAVGAAGNNSLTVHTHPPSPAAATAAPPLTAPQQLQSSTAGGNVPPGSAGVAAGGATATAAAPAPAGVGPAAAVAGVAGTDDAAAAEGEAGGRKPTQDWQSKTQTLVIEELVYSNNGKIYMSSDTSHVPEAGKAAVGVACLVGTPWNIVKNVWQGAVLSDLRPCWAILCSNSSPMLSGSNTMPTIGMHQILSVVGESCPQCRPSTVC